MSSTHDRGVLALRLLMGSPMIALHGWGKAQALFAEGPVSFADPLHLGATPTLIIAVLTEFVAPMLVLLGVRTRWAASATAATMSVALVFVHGGALTGDHSGELAYLYLVGFVVLAIMGGGRYALERGGRAQEQDARDD
ncbi:MAG: DoxX family protein [Gemmatimonadaceae bacterium]|jgi:putative oxidoreductase|nr:DoxX family protein [Gemmatimonadota bacterium]